MAKTNTGLVEYAKKQVGRPYWYGTYGQTATEELYNGKKKQYPKYYTATDFSKQYGQRVHDCSGLIEGYMMSETPDTPPKYKSKYDYTANGLRAACKEKGDIDTLPEIPGVCVFYDGHVGVYIGNGEVIEARGHSYGVVKTKLSARGWKWWGKHPQIEYVTAAQPDSKPVTDYTDVPLPTIRPGASGTAVKRVQAILNSLGYKNLAGNPLTVDGDYGSVTEKRIREFQSSNGLTADGIIGQKTWGKLITGD